MNFDADIAFLTEALPQMQDYLLSNELYWPLSASLPRLTLGALLLALTRIEGIRPVEADRLRGQMESFRVRWRAAWEKKAAREMENRLRLWSNYLSDYRSSPEQNADSYRTEVRLRVILELLQPETSEFSSRSALYELDIALKRSLIPGGFVWESELESAFPEKQYWFLYGKLNP